MTGGVRVSGLTHRYGTLPVLDAVELTALDGELVAVVGPTGCGKSTLLRILAGLATPSSGTATINGRSAIATPGLASYMPQGDSLLPWRTALQNAVLGARIARDDTTATAARARELFARFGLLGFEDAWPRSSPVGCANEWRFFERCWWTVPWCCSTNHSARSTNSPASIFKAG